MVSLFEFNDYKVFVNAWIAEKGKVGRGELQRMAKALAIHPTLVSHVFRGAKNLSLEQASQLSRYFVLRKASDFEYTSPNTLAGRF